MAGDVVVSVAEDQKAHAKIPSSQPQLAEDTIEYECCICADDFPSSAGVAHCEEHLQFLFYIWLLFADVANEAKEVLAKEARENAPRILIDLTVSSPVIKPEDTDDSLFVLESSMSLVRNTDASVPIWKRTYTRRSTSFAMLRLAMKCLACSQSWGIGVILVFRLPPPTWGPIVVERFREHLDRPAQPDVGNWGTRTFIPVLSF